MNKIIWNNINWNKVATRIFKYQQRIYWASLQNNKKKVKFIQKEFVNNLDAKLLAVRRVTTDNRRRKMADIDQVMTSHEKEQLVENLKIDGKAYIHRTKAMVLFLAPPI